MKRILLASAACLALSLPALAQNNAQSNDASLKAGTQGHGQPASMAANLKQAEINPSTLTRDEIRGIQESLDKAGFNTKKADASGARKPGTLL